MHLFGWKPVHTSSDLRSIQDMSSRRAELKHKPFGSSPGDAQYLADAVKHVDDPSPTIPKPGLKPHLYPNRRRSASLDLGPIKNSGDLLVRMTVVKPLVYIYRNILRPSTKP